MGKAKKLYRSRNIKELEPLYSMNVEAMSAEKLHSKADIAAEIAHRDFGLLALGYKVEQLQARIAELEGGLETEREAGMRLVLEQLHSLNLTLEPCGHNWDLYEAGFGHLDEPSTEEVIAYLDAKTKQSQTVDDKAALDGGLSNEQ